ncbi:MAG: DUF1573 domain-containing protein [Bacteroidetes bacterium]|nr:DUF1573 domain-containing protein [Bacteroidota bacterium]MDA1268938.1 DUF1573 domain-containing protein [Bacteroidota bacterium]
MIRLFFFLFSGFLLGFHSYGQQQGVPKLVWKVNRIDLGTIMEEQGLQSVEFEYTLSHGSFFAIQDILTDCGCTTVAFSKDSLAQGQSGKILVDFDPSSASGFFSKLVLVKGNKGQIQDSLYIEGIAIPYPSNLERNYPVKLGYLGFRMNKVNMGDVFDNEPKVKYLEFFNYGSQPLEKKNLQVKSPNFIQVEQVQELVRPMERGLLKISYSASLRPELGAVSDQIQINWGKTEAIELVILADLFDYFASISKSDLQIVPQLYLPQKAIDFGDISANTVQRLTIVLSNLGKEDLEIRKVQENCSCLVLEHPKKIILPGEKMELNLVFDPIGRKGIDQRNIYIFTNDPINPVQLLVLKSRID